MTQDTDNNRNEARAAERLVEEARGQVQMVLGYGRWPDVGPRADSPMLDLLTRLADRVEADRRQIERLVENFTEEAEAAYGYVAGSPGDDWKMVRAVGDAYARCASKLRQALQPTENQ